MPRSTEAARGPQIVPRARQIMRKLISSGSPYEPKVGISRAVRAGAIVTVAGTAPLGPDGRTVGHGDAAAQARRCLEIIAAALEAAGASLHHVVRTRILLTRIDDWQEVAAVHGEIMSMPTPARAQRRYDHRLRSLVQLYRRRDHRHESRRPSLDGPWVGRQGTEGRGEPGRDGPERSRPSSKKSWSSGAA